MLPGMNDSKNLTLRELLDYCSDPQSPRYQRAWDEFYHRYNQYIHSTVRHRLFRSRYSQVSPLSDIVDEIVMEVYGRLIKNDCSALKGFVFRDDERKFVAWLKIICSRGADTFLTKYLGKPLASELEDFERQVMWKMTMFCNHQIPEQKGYERWMITI